MSKIQKDETNLWKIQITMKNCSYYMIKDLQQWFIVWSKIEGMTKLKASKGFLNSFKQEFRISGCKIMKLLTKNNA